MDHLLKTYKHKLSKVGVSPSSSSYGMVFIPEEGVASDEIRAEYTLEQWKDAEANGAVFLPAAGFIGSGGTNVDKANTYCEYWLSDYDDGDRKIYHFNSQSAGGIVETPTSNRQAFAVRLVSDVLK